MLDLLRSEWSRGKRILTPLAQRNSSPTDESSRNGSVRRAKDAMRQVVGGGAEKGAAGQLHRKDVLPAAAHKLRPPSVHAAPKRLERAAAGNLWRYLCWTWEAQLQLVRM